MTLPANGQYVLYSSNPVYQIGNDPTPSAPIEYGIDPVAEELGRRRWMPPFKIGNDLPLIDLSARELISGYAGKAFKPKSEFFDPKDMNDWLGTLPGVTPSAGHMT